MTRIVAALIFVVVVAVLAVATLVSVLVTRAPSRTVAPVVVASDSVTIIEATPTAVAAWLRGDPLVSVSANQRNVQPGDMVHLCYVRWAEGKAVPLNEPATWSVEGGDIVLGPPSDVAPEMCRWVLARTSEGAASLRGTM